MKIGAKVVSHRRCVTFQMAEVAIPLPLFAEILQLIAGLMRSKHNPIAKWYEPSAKSSLFWASSGKYRR